MFGPLDLQRLAVRIERLQQKSRQSWQWRGDGLDFRNHMPGGQARNVLPSPQFLRDLADNYKEQVDNDGEDMQLAKRQWRIWIQIALRMESLTVRNDPRSPHNLMRQFMNGKFPRF